MTEILTPKRAHGAQAWRFASSLSLARAPTVGSQLLAGANNFNALRFLAASAVVFSHCYALSGHLDAEPLAVISAGIIDIGTAAVMAFFVISGFLITMSAQSQPSLAHFVAARLLRMWPGLLLTTLLVMFLVGPLLSDASLADYFSSRENWRYMIYAPTLDVGVNLPGVFANNPVPHSVNGSLWTIQVEVWLYAATAILMMLGVMRHAKLLSLVCFSAVLAFLLFHEQMLPWMVRQESVMMPRLIGCFLLGSLMYANAQRVPLSLPLGFALLLATALSIWYFWFVWVLYMTFAYWVLLLALHPRLLLYAPPIRADYSYGIYIFAFPIQQSVVSLFDVNDPIKLFLASYPIILVFAAMSWHGVESKALGLKRLFSAQRSEGV